MVLNIASRLRQIGRERLRLLAYLTGGHFAVHWFMQIFPLILPAVKAALGLTDVQVGALSTARELATGAVNFPAGMLADRLARFRAVILACAILAMGVAYLVFGLVPGFALAFVASCCVGVGIALWHPTAMASLSSRFPEHRATALAIHGMGATLSDTVTPLIVGALFLFYPWYAVMALQMVLAGFLAIPIWRGLRGIFALERPVSRRDQSSGMGVFIRNPAFLGIAAGNGLMNTGRLLVMTFFPIYVQEHLSYSALGLGFYYTLLHVLGTVSQPILGYLSDRFGRKAVLVPSFLMLGVLYTMIGFVAPGFPLGLVVTLIGLFFYTLTNVTAAAVTDVAGLKFQATSLGLSFLTNNLFTLPGPIIAGYMIGICGIASVFVFAGGLLLVGAVVIAPLKLYGGSKAGSEVSVRGEG
jgi:MFS family permease